MRIRVTTRADLFEERKRQLLVYRVYRNKKDACIGQHTRALAPQNYLIPGLQSRDIRSQRIDNA